MAKADTSSLVERPGALVDVVVDKRYIEAAQRVNVSQLRTQHWDSTDGNPAILIRHLCICEVSNATVTVHHNTLCLVTSSLRIVTRDHASYEGSSFVEALRGLRGYLVDLVVLVVGFVVGSALVEAL